MDDEPRESSADAERDGTRDDGADGADGDEHPDESRRPVYPRCPREPTRLEREEHEISHIPPRAWCAHCSAGRTTRGAHRSSVEAPEHPILSMDYAYLGASAADEQAMAERAQASGATNFEEDVPRESVPILVLHDSRSSAIYGVSIDRKGTSQRVACRVLDIYYQCTRIS